MSMLLRVKALLALMGVDGGDEAITEAEVLRLLEGKANANHKHDADYLHLGTRGYTNQLHPLGGPVNLINRAPGEGGANEPIFRLGSQIANGMLRADRWVADVYYDAIHFRRAPGSEVYIMDFNPDSPTAIINRVLLETSLTPLWEALNCKQGTLLAGTGITLSKDGKLSIDPSSIPPGEKGDPGPQGPQGAKGAKGEKGDTGATGPQGEKGEKGDVGPQGERGLQGIQGLQGPQGLPGVKGEKGDRGEQGPQGLPGKDGSDYTLPSASATALGGILVGPGLSATETGLLSVDVQAEVTEASQLPVSGTAVRVYVEGILGNIDDLLEAL